MLFGGNFPQKHRKRKHKAAAWRRTLITLAAALVLPAIAAAALLRFYAKPPALPPEPVLDHAPVPVHTARKTMVRKPADEIDAELFARPGSPRENYYNILLLGTDGDGMRTDAILIARLDAEAHTVALMSIPRDTLIEGDYAVPKLNSVYGANGAGESGVRALRKHLASMLGIEVSGYLLVDLEGFSKLVDLVGGVPFDVPRQMYYDDPAQALHIDLPEGFQVLNGRQALQLVRYRGYATADIQRTRVQQDFLKALGEKCLSLGGIKRLKPIVELGIEAVDTDLSPGNLLYLTRELLQCDFGELKSFTLPGEGVWICGGSYYELDASRVREIVNEFFNPYDADIPVERFHIRTEFHDPERM